MSQKIDLDLLKNLITSALKPLDEKINDICSRISQISDEIRELKSVVSNSNSDGSTKPGSYSEAVTTPASSTKSTPASRPSLTAAAQREKRTTAIRAKEKISTQANRPTRPTSLQRRGQPAKIELSSQHTPTDKKKIITDKIITTDATPLTSNSNQTTAIEKNTTTVTPTSIPTTPTTDVATENGEQWITVTKRQPRKSSAIRGSATNTGIQGIERYTYLHGCYFKTETTTDSLIDHLKKVDGGLQYIVEKIPSKHDTYTSFKIGIPAASIEKFMATDVWPLNTNISKWRPFLLPRPNRPPDESTGKDTPNNQH